MSNLHGIVEESQLSLMHCKHLGNGRASRVIWWVPVSKLYDGDGIDSSRWDKHLPTTPKEEIEGQRSKAWPHVDQSPNRRFKHCV